MEDYYSLVVHLDLQWHKAKEYKQNTRVPGPSKPQTTSTNPTKLGKLTDKEHTYFKGKGIYFWCREEGHIAQGCTMFPKNSLSPLLPKAPFWKIQVATQRGLLCWHLADCKSQFLL